VLIDIADGRLTVADTACRIVVGEGRPIGCCTLSGLAARTSDFSEGWGLVPFWAKDIKVGFANINAKAEGIEGKPAFREAFERRRCLVPVDNFYCGREAALRGRARGRWADGAGGSVGELALTGRRVGAQLRHHHYGAERAVRRAARSDAGGPEAGPTRFPLSARR
jgi:hypothetical protein